MKNSGRLRIGDDWNAINIIALSLRYICRLYAKELVLRNFIGAPADELLERLIELSL